jgi:hypothetical protein
MEAANKAVQQTAPDPWRDNEEARRRQLREDGARPLAVNLAEGLALSEFLSTFTGSARDNLAADPLKLRRLWEMKRASGRARDRDDLEALEAAQEKR